MTTRGEQQRKALCAALKAGVYRLISRGEGLKSLGHYEQSAETHLGGTVGDRAALGGAANGGSAHGLHLLTNERDAACGATAIANPARS